MTDFDILEVRSRQAHFFVKGKLAREDNQPITSHNLNPGTPTIADFERGWKQVDYELRRFDARVKVQSDADVMNRVGV